MPGAISQAQAAGKKLIIEEWGSLVGSGRTANLQSNIQKINNYKVPWIYWELITNPDPHQGEDYEVRPLLWILGTFTHDNLFQIQVSGADWGTISSGSLSTIGLANAPFDFGPSLALWRGWQQVKDAKEISFVTSRDVELSSRVKSNLITVYCLLGRSLLNSKLNHV